MGTQQAEGRESGEMRELREEAQGSGGGLGSGADGGREEVKCSGG